MLQITMAEALWGSLHHKVALCQEAPHLDRKALQAKMEGLSILPKSLTRAETKAWRQLPQDRIMPPGPLSNRAQKGEKVVQRLDSLRRRGVPQATKKICDATIKQISI
ncbi:hypothetical protein SAMN05421882_101121 [Nitrosomonas communis]|uniref:Uncharacterized protein n=1 Tax=Nitrosomonas communis TaxID=44574 RepID=A0A1H2THT8_9PROT|nr:hypothetical protein SAMN05421882_101121 [Nitrosomonas communis]